MRIGSLACQGVTLHHPPDSLLSPPRLRTEDRGTVRGTGDSEGARISWRPDSIPVLYSCPHARPSYTFYTDGSTGPDKARMSGSALVQLNTERAGNVERTHGFAVRASGSNYLAEM